ncbi:MAG: DUF115 domain-containing protein [Bacteroidales bacterium]|nr:DUF115 domain-containing protein [Bacteroidales bacterium]
MSDIESYQKWMSFKSYFKGIPLISSFIRYVKWRFFWPVYSFAVGFCAKHRCWLKQKGILNCAENDLRLLQLRDSHKGETAFIIGNGPSLRVEDLEKLYTKGVFCFASNRINVIFPETQWRPNCYTAIDPDIYRNNDQTIPNTLHENLDLYVVTKQIFSGFEKNFQKQANCMWFNMKPISYYSKVNEFSTNAMAYLMNGFSVTYLSMQLAYYMGFKKVYLLGVDCDYARVLDKKGKVVQSEGKRSYFSDKYDSTNKNSAFTEGMIQAYECAERFAKDSKGRFSIYNASRGGKLKVFDNVNFDEVIENL